MEDDNNNVGTTSFAEKVSTEFADIKKKLSKYITKREIIIAAVVALIVFLVLCNKPYFGDFFTVWKPAFWNVTKIASDGGYKFVIPQAGQSDGGTELDNVIIKDVSSELSDEIQTAKDYILKQMNDQIELADNSLYPRGTTVEQIQIFEVGRMDTAGQEMYYFIFTPGGEYSGNKLLQVAIKKGDKLVCATYRSRWMNFDNNYQKAYNMIKSIRIK